MDPFIAEIRIFTGNFAPIGWAFCNGQLLLISQNTALFSILGTNYGGDGRTTFGLPNLQGRVPIMAGRGPGLADRTLGEIGGTPTVALGNSEMPAHTHQVACLSKAGTQNTPTGALWASAHCGRPSTNMYAASGGTTDIPMAATLAPTGGGQPHNNMHPFLTLNFIIALQGIFPSRG